MSKQKILNNIWVCKRALRRINARLDSLSTDTRMNKRAIHELKPYRFSAHRVALLENDQACLNEFQSSARGKRRTIALGLSQMMLAYDKYESTDHERAQILNISHIAYEKFLEKHPESRGSLHASAFMRAETFMEKEVFVGERGARDYPLFAAAQCEFIDMYDRNAEFRKTLRTSLDRLLGSIPRYQQVMEADGSISFARMPPKLEVVKP